MKPSIQDKKKIVTLGDVARHVGVSSSTVSRALTGSSGVTPHKLAAINAAIEELGYRPNEAARELANGTSKVVGVLSQHLASPFYGEMVTGIERGLQGSGYSPMIIGGNWQLSEQLRALDVFLQRRVNSLIILGGNIPDHTLQEVSSEIPLIVIGRTVSGLEHQSIDVDHQRGGYLATQHLIELGHEQIAHISGIPDHLDSVARQQGYQQALTEAGLAVDPRLIVQGDFREQSGVLAFEMLLMRGVTFTAVFVANDQMATGVQLALYRRGIRVPQEMSIVGFDDQPGSAFSCPPLTTVRQPVIEMGHAAAQGILAMLAGESPELPQLALELMIRESTTRLSRSGSLSERERTSPVADRLKR